MRTKEVALAFGRVLREARLKKGFSQNVLAAQCNFDRTYSSLLERGLRSPTLAMVFRLSEALELSPLVLVTRTHDELGQRRISGGGDFKSDLQGIMQVFQALYPSLTVRETEAGWLLEARKVNEELCVRMT